MYNGVKKNNRLPVALLAAVLSIFFLTASHCEAARFDKLSVSFKDGKLTLEAGFDSPVSYRVRAENNGRTLILHVPGASYFKRILEQTKIPSNTVLSGWSLRNARGALAVKFRLNGPYSYSHTYKGPNTVQIEIYGAKKAQQASVPPIFAPSPAIAAEKTTSALIRGIELFNEGQYDEALSKFKEEASNNERCPLLYYYAAHIRLKKKQYNRARDNLQAALRDSSDFSDARGLLAYTHLKLGNANDALAEWRSFVRTAGKLDDDMPVTIDHITLPEEYRVRIARKREEQRKALTLKKARADSIATAIAEVKESAPVSSTPPDSSVQTVEEPAVNGAETTGSLEERHMTNIRDGLLFLAVSIVLLTAFISGAVIWIRKRLRNKADLTFNEEVRKIIEEQTETTELFENDEEQVKKEFQSISREIAEIGTTPGPVVPKTEEPLITPDFSTAEEYSFQGGRNLPFESRSETITEEVKVLVTRMFREGRSISEIARASDLTKTEVELIVAVRARKMEQLIEEATNEDEEFMDTSHLNQAITELKSEGGTHREIAKKLGISTSEVQLAVSLMNMRKERRSG